MLSPCLRGDVQVGHCSTPFPDLKLLKQVEIPILTSFFLAGYPFWKISMVKYQIATAQILRNDLQIRIHLAAEEQPRIEVQHLDRLSGPQ